MPRLSTFYGLIIHMPGNDHDPPHFHVEYAESSGRILVRTGELLPGSTLPRRALRLVEGHGGPRVDHQADHLVVLRR